jgi:hypothetical protein
MTYRTSLSDNKIKIKRQQDKLRKRVEILDTAEKRRALREKERILRQQVKSM